MHILQLQFVACAVCRESMIGAGGDAAGWSIFFLLGVVVSILAGIGYFMVFLARRAKANFDPTLSDDYQPSEAINRTFATDSSL